MDRIHAENSAATRNREARVRRAASRQGLHVSKVREGSRWYQQYGPYMLCDAGTSGVLLHGIDLDLLESHLVEEAVTCS